MTRATVVAVTLVILALVAVLTVVTRFIGEDRAELTRRFSTERLRQLSEATREIGEDFDDIADDLRFAGQLVSAADSPGDRERELGALIAVVRHYRMVRVFDSSGTPVLSVVDPNWNTGVPVARFDATLAELARTAAHQPSGEVETTPAFADDPSGWLRAFGTALPTGTGSIVVVVDVEPLFRQLRLLVSEPGTRLLVLGARGKPAPISDTQLARLAVTPPAGAHALLQLLDRMHEAAQGTLGLDAHEAALLGLGQDPITVAYGSVPLPWGAHWSVATLSGTGALRANERAIFLRLGLGAGASALCLLVFGAYVVIAERRAAAVRERLRQADEMARLQEQLLRAEKMATVGVLAAGIAHEIGTPLGVVRARTEMTLGKLGQEHALAPGLRVITEQIDRVSRTIRQLLDFSRTRPAAVQSVDVGHAARAVQELLALEGERRGVQLAVEVPDGLPAVAADPDQLQQVLVNLVMNGLDACANRPGGKVELRARLDDATGGPMQIQVIDTGCGIAPELRHQIFDPFFTTKKRGQGTGLGLTLTARMVAGHHGDIAVDSHEGRGTTVTMRWPIAGARAEVIS
jgi:signal transduction histidine kinase